MMTPKEKAQELLTKYTIATWIKFNEIKYLSKIPTAKQCALIAVDEILSANPHSNPFNTDVYSTMDYWQEVKKEIESI